MGDRYRGDRRYSKSKPHGREARFQSDRRQRDASTGFDRRSRSDEGDRVVNRSPRWSRRISKSKPHGREARFQSDRRQRDASTGFDRRSRSDEGDRVVNRSPRWSRRIARGESHHHFDNIRFIRSRDRSPRDRSPRDRSPRDRSPHRRDKTSANAVHYPSSFAQSGPSFSRRPAKHHRHSQQWHYQSTSKRRMTSHNQGRSSESHRHIDVSNLFNFNILELAKGSSERVLEAFQTNESGFLSVFSSGDYCTTPENLKALIKIVHLIITSKEEELASRVLAHIYSPDGQCAKFCFQVDRLLKNIPKHSTVPKDDLQCLHYVVQIGLFGVNEIPVQMIESFPQPTLQEAMKAVCRVDDIGGLKEQCIELEMHFKKAREVYRTKSSVQTDKSANPSKHITEIDILPGHDEILSDRMPFLRSNKIEGAYEEWDHYLDIQFRLLREDFIEPLRESIAHVSSSQQSTTVYVYSGVHVLTPVCLLSGLGFEISFDALCLKNMNWEHSRRLIYGSLLCLSKNNFRESPIVFATVVKRDAGQLKEGRLVVKFEGKINGFDIDPNDEYTMIESTAYFEAYRHVLLKLQNTSLSKDTMPFKRYIIKCQLSEPHSPLYLRTFSAHFNLTKVIKFPGGSNVKILDESTWPSHHKTCLDKSQYRALKMALGQEVSCIQGPPGTGKTFIGLKLVEAFLENRVAWDPMQNCPILLVCYTNHALDQFLEQIIDIYVENKEPTPHIVRIGGRCKSENIAQCVLAKRITETLLPLTMRKARDSYQNEVYTRKRCLFKLWEQLKSKNRNLILKLHELKCVILPQHYSQLSHGMLAENGREIEIWLGIRKPTECYDDFNDEENEPGQLAICEVPIRQEDHSDEFIIVDEVATILEDERVTEEEVIFNEDIAPTLPSPCQRKRKRCWRAVEINQRELAHQLEGQYEYIRPMRESDAKQIKDVCALDKKERCQLYHYWILEYLKSKKTELIGAGEAYTAACNKLSKVKKEIDCYVASRADVIGMTTTGAAKHHHILEKMCPKIVIIEEAAEVFESHVITSLTPSVQQLILIGDHQQLRPKPNSYRLEKYYNLDVSLFERLIKNGMAHVTLTVQHRMSPEIAALIHPTIYSKLQNGTKAIENGKHKVAGVACNLFLLNHAHPEKPRNESESLSHVNPHEAEFMVALCRYLLKQGYKNTQVTLLTMYNGQLLELRNKMKRNEFNGVRVAAVDDYQGEENDIILLSLVRNNSDKNIGFLNVENRVCVALSRAKIGLYVMGNFTMLKKCDNTIWPKIISVAEKRGCIGECLLLCCQNHPNEEVEARVAADFSNCPEGGCTKPCNYRHNCGHVCSLMCHPSDTEHRRFRCRKRCEKELTCKHKCKRMCYECIKGCPPCSEYIDVQMRKCRHLIKVKCSDTEFQCSAPCPKQLPCGHQCKQLCCEPCDPNNCLVEVKKDLPCGHSITVPCNTSIDTVMCSSPCEILLQCEHECKGTCGTCQQGRLHVRCQSKCGRTLVCGHICNYPCAKECPPCQQECLNYCRHSKCRKQCYEPCVACIEPCEWNCKHHKCNKKCGEPCNRQRCNNPCEEFLKCGHPCIGLCGDICPTLCRICNKDKVTDIFFGEEDNPDARFVQLQECNHLFEHSSLDKWMDQTESGEIKFKTCPCCSTPIRTSLRYYNEVKEVHNHFEKIKKMQLRETTSSNLMPMLQQLKKELEEKQPKNSILADVSRIESTLNYPIILPHCLSAVENQLQILPIIASVYKELAEIKQKTWQLKSCSIKQVTLKNELVFVQKFLMQESLSDQQVGDLWSEIQRLKCTVHLFRIYYLIKNREINVTPEDIENLDATASRVYLSGAGSTPRVTEEDVESVSMLIKELKEKYDLDGLTDTQRVEIVKAIGLSKGRWFKCPNGHYYCIGECGGAMEVAKCPECDAEVGGTNHRLLEDNQLAPEMDGAAYPAWSDQANIANYILMD